MAGILQYGISICAIALLLATTAGPAQSAEYLVLKVDGPPPQAVPVPHVATRYIHSGDILITGADILMIAKSAVVLIDKSSGRRYRIIGPNRFRIEAKRLFVHNRAGLKVTKPQKLK